MRDRFIFMMALPRSGTTLLAYVLDSHSRIHVEHEDSGGPNTTAPDRATLNLRTKIREGFESYLQRFLIAHDKEYLVASRYYARQHVKLIAEALGDRAKFIILTRRHMWRVFRDADGKAHVVALRQLLEFSACRRMVKHDFRHMEIAYEKMVTYPQQVFAGVCEFIGVEFEPEMLEYGNFDHSHLSNRGNEKTRRFGRIIDTAGHDEASGLFLVRSAVTRIGLKWGAASQNGEVDANATG